MDSSLPWVFGLCSLALGCGPRLVAGDGTSGTQDSATTDADADGDGDTSTNSSDDWDDEPTTGEGDGDGDEGPGDGDGDTGPCESFEVECPDATCVNEFIAEYPCCGHGGACALGCEPQAASSTADDCVDLLYAWTGLGCQSICACEGADCGELYPGMGACLSDHEPECGQLHWDHCPFETPLGPTLVSGTTDIGPNEYVVGAFGLVYGEGPVNYDIMLATDVVVLGNWLWNYWQWNFGQGPATNDVLRVGGLIGQPGVYDVWVGVADPASDYAAGTLTVSLLDTEGAGYEAYQLWAQLDVNDGAWDLHGEFAVPGCQVLEMHLP